MIRRLTQNDAESVFDLVGEVYDNHSFLELGRSNYEDAITSEQYVSLGFFDSDKLVGHAGFASGEGFVLINALVVSRSVRSRGIGKLLFDARLNEIEHNTDSSFIVGYSMMQHSYSQRLYGDDFKPIGIDIGYPDLYTGSDTEFNAGYSSNAEIILCRNRSTPPQDWRPIAVRDEDRQLAKDITGSIGITCEYQQDSGIEASKIFLGFHPDLTEGLLIPAFLDRGHTFETSNLHTSSEERRLFVERILGGSNE